MIPSINKQTRKSLPCAYPYYAYTYFVPTSTGHPPCSMAMSVLPDLLMLCQKTAELRSGRTDTPSRGKAVRPPRET